MPRPLGFGTPSRALRTRHGPRRVLARADGLPRRPRRSRRSDERPRDDRLPAARRPRGGALHAPFRGRDVSALLSRTAGRELQGRLRARVHEEGRVSRRARVRVAGEARRDARRGRCSSRSPPARPSLPASPEDCDALRVDLEGRRNGASRAAAGRDGRPPPSRSGRSPPAPSTPACRFRSPDSSSRAGRSGRPESSAPRPRSRPSSSSRCSNGATCACTGAEDVPSPPSTPRPARSSRTSSRIPTPKSSGASRSPQTTSRLARGRAGAIAPSGSPPRARFSRVPQGRAGAGG